MPETITYKDEVFVVPDMEQISDWVFDCICEALDECPIEPDGHCEHGYPSWLIALNLI